MKKAEIFEGNETVDDRFCWDQMTGDEAWHWLREQLVPGMLADESEFIEESAEEAIARNKKRLGLRMEMEA